MLQHHETMIKVSKFNELITADKSKTETCKRTFGRGQADEKVVGRRQLRRTRSSGVAAEQSDAPSGVSMKENEILIVGKEQLVKCGQASRRAEEP